MTELLRPNIKYTRTDILNLTNLGSELDNRFLKTDLHRWISVLTQEERKSMHDPSRPESTSSNAFYSGIVWRLLTEPTRCLTYRIPDIQPDIVCLQAGHPRDMCTCPNLRKRLVDGTWVERGENRPCFAVGMKYATKVAEQYPDNKTLPDMRADGVGLFQGFVKNFRPPTFQEPLPF